MVTPQVRPLLASLTLAIAVVAGCAAPSAGPEASISGLDALVEASMKDLKFGPQQLTVTVGTTVTWVNDDPFMHTVTAADGSFDSGEMQQGDTWSHTFTEPGVYELYCKPHAAKQKDGSYKGMVATVTVTEAPAQADASSSTGRGPSGLPDLAAPLPVDVDEIGRAVDDLPPPVGRGAPAHVTFDIESREVVGEMADGTTYTYWTFDGTVPGPMLRVREGDTVTVNLHNSADSTVGHNIDLHAVTGPGGGAGILDAAPGETATLTFKALNAGVFVYHCAYQDPPLHIAHGMYGLIVVEPEDGLPPVDEEFYVMQGDFYSPHTASDKGHHEYDGTRAAAEDPTFVVFNGRMGSLADPARQLRAEVGDTVRLFVGNGGPNLVSSFHVIGEIFDDLYAQGSLTSAPLESIQTTLVPAGGAVVADFTLEVPGDYYLVDHSIFRIHKGAFGVLHVTGEDDPETYRSGP